jgi:hypothetical protein
MKQGGRKMKTKTTHTPGPWEVIQHKDDTVLTVWAENHPTGPQAVAIIDMAGDPSRKHDESGIADARLIAAAPDLLEAAKFVLATGITGHRASAQVARLEAAIAKAGGK